MCFNEITHHHSSLNLSRMDGIVYIYFILQVDEPEVKTEIKEESEDGYSGVNNTTASSCDYSLSQFKDEPLSELPPEEESEEDMPLVTILHVHATGSF